MIILNINTFNKKDLPEVFKIGYLSNDAICVLSKIINKPKKEIEKTDVKALEDILTLFEDVETGKESIEGYLFSGSNSNKVSIYWQLLKLLIVFTQNKSYEQIIEDISKYKEKIQEIVNFLNHKLELSEDEKEKKIENIKSFLSILSNNYQNVFFNR